MVVRAVALCMVIGTANLFASDSLAEGYNKITGGLISIRKQFPVVQPRVYSLLDQVDKLYKVAREQTLEVAALKKKLQERQQETKEHIDNAKKLVENAKAELAKKFEEQSTQLQALRAERDQLLGKISLADQSLGQGSQKQT